MPEICKYEMGERFEKQKGHKLYYGQEHHEKTGFEYVHKHFFGFVQKYKRKGCAFVFCYCGYPDCKKINFIRTAAEQENCPLVKEKSKR